MSRHDKHVEEIRHRLDEAEPVEETRLDLDLEREIRRIAAIEATEPKR